LTQAVVVALVLTACGLRRLAAVLFAGPAELLAALLFDVLPIVAFGLVPLDTRLVAPLLTDLLILLIRGRTTAIVASLVDATAPVVGVCVCFARQWGWRALPVTGGGHLHRRLVESTPRIAVVLPGPVLFAGAGVAGCATRLALHELYALLADQLALRARCAEGLANHLPLPSLLPTHLIGVVPLETHSQATPLRGAVCTIFAAIGRLTVSALLAQLLALCCRVAFAAAGMDEGDGGNCRR